MHNNLEVEEKDGKYGYCNKWNGEEVIPPRFDKAYNFHEGLATVSLNQKYGYIDINGDIVIPIKYDWAEAFLDGMGQVKSDDIISFIDKQGKIVVSLLGYDEAEAYFFSEGLSRVVRNNKHGFVDLSGNEIIPTIYQNSGYSFLNGINFVQKDDKYGFIDTQGNVVIPFEYDDANCFQDGVAEVELNGEWIKINKEGNTVIE